MSKGVNKVVILGNLGQEPEVRAIPGGGSAATISVATSQQWNDKASGEKKEQTEWHRIVFFGKLADVVAKYLHKGSKVYVEGKLQTKKWTDKNGVERYTTQILASEMQMLDGAKEGRATAPNVENLPASGSHDTIPFNDDDIPF